MIIVSKSLDRNLRLPLKSSTHQFNYLYEPCFCCHCRRRLPDKKSKAVPNLWICVPIICCCLYFALALVDSPVYRTPTSSPEHRSVHDLTTSRLLSEAKFCFSIFLVSIQFNIRGTASLGPQLMYGRRCVLAQHMSKDGFIRVLVIESQGVKSKLIVRGAQASILVFGKRQEGALAS